MNPLVDTACCQGPLLPPFLRPAPGDGCLLANLMGSQRAKDHLMWLVEAGLLAESRASRCVWVGN